MSETEATLTGPPIPDPTMMLRNSLLAQPALPFVDVHTRRPATVTQLL